MCLIWGVEEIEHEATVKPLWRDLVLVKCYKTNTHNRFLFIHFFLFFFSKLIGKLLKTLIIVPCMSRHHSAKKKIKMDKNASRRRLSKVMLISYDLEYVYFPAGIWRCNDVILTSMHQHQHDVVCPLFWSIKRCSNSAIMPWLKQKILFKMTNLQEFLIKCRFQRILMRNRLCRADPSLPLLFRTAVVRKAINHFFVRHVYP